jgi:ubiquitin C-terminal hydrolase
MQKQFVIAEPPNVLILHLKRFDVLTDTKVKVAPLAGL